MTIAGTWLKWSDEKARWPHAGTSRFIPTQDFDWHVQLPGQETGPKILLLHGTGASSHSWRNLVSQMEGRFQFIVPDLPCHSFTTPKSTPDLSLHGMAKAIAALLEKIDVKPDVILGHSAGAAIGVALAAGTFATPASLGNVKQVVAINGAFLPIRGYRLFSPMAKALFANPLSATMFSMLAGSTPLGGNLLQATGSSIDPLGRDIYRTLLGSSGHVRGALGMMAAWDLSRFDDLLRHLKVPLTLIATRDDPMVPHDNSVHAARTAPRAQLVSLSTGGHLVHECNAQEVARQIEHAVFTRTQNGADAA